MIILDPELLPQNCSQLLCQWLIVLCSYDVTFVMTSQSWAQPFLTSQSCVFNRALLSAAISLIYNTSVMFLWYSGLQLDPNYLFQWLFWHVLSDITLTLKMLPCYPQFQVFSNINCLLKLLWIECCKAQHIFSTEWLNHAPQFTNICTDKKLRVQRQQKDLQWKKILFIVTYTYL